MAPLPALAIEAVFAVDPLQTGEVVVILALGAAVMVTDLLPDALQPALLVTVTESFTIPDVPAI